ncbi:outer membrane protein assembly factor BamB [Thiomicrorhabdus sp. 6S2-11]|uniref:Outer membrane protein assembly factor BamB n=1 Tax=Thiomicrorhabdus marina TaxID=2818442 RepID=A0ABS3Q620_9GAMM|nr:outer membrane protein assembly factor BamB [Thiomicrorhabdus marina]MBO1927727.1 outer membrane protein assembly factor BamB [Thiomicrorhabdus marina]
MKASPSKLLAAIFMSSTLVGCSSTIKLEEPPKAQLDSELTMDLQWQIEQADMPNGDTRGLAIEQSADKVFVANSQGFITALQKDNQSRWTDQVLWENRFDEVITAGPSLDGSNLYIGTAKGRLKALNPRNGEMHWQVQLSSEVLGKPTVLGDAVYTRTVDGKVYALNRRDGKVIWVSEHQMPSLSLRGAPEVLPTADMVFVAWETGIIQALSTVSGELQWEARIAIPSGRTDLERMVDVQANMLVQDGVLYALGFHGKLAAINPANGNFVFIKEVSGFRDFVVDEQSIYLVDENDVLYAFDNKSGTQLWKQQSMKNRFVGDLEMYKDQLLVTDAWGYVHWFNKLQGTEQSRYQHSNEYGDGDKIVRAEVDGDSVYLFDGDGLISRYLVRPSNLAQFRKEYGDTWY